MTLGELEAMERRLKASILALNKNKVAEVTLVEAIDEALLWPEPFDSLAPIAASHNLDNLLARVPLLICAIAAEIGFRFEGVGTVFWTKFSDALGLPVTIAQRQLIAGLFEAQTKRYGLAQPSESAFSSHFSIIAWPIANALLPVDLVGPVGRLLARAPVAALPGLGRTTNFPSLRAWASAAEGARLTDWLRFEAPSARVLAALLTDNRGAVLSDASYTRLRYAIGTDPEAFLAARTARLRGRTAKRPNAAEQTLGRLALMVDPTGIHLFASWPALPPALYDEARSIGRSAGWKPRLWGTGAFLHPDTALGTGPFAIARQTVEPGNYALCDGVYHVYANVPECCQTLRDDLRLGIRALLAALSSPPAERPDETAWLIELSPKVSRTPTYYGVGGDGVLGWTTDHLLAVRFCRRQNAQAVLDDLGITEGFVSEHAWTPLPTPPKDEAR